MNEFFYEHIGHMQISVLTLELYKVIYEITLGKVNNFVEASKIINNVKKKGFTEKVVLSELDRFCYGFECMETYFGSKRMISLTDIGVNYFKEIVNSDSKQSSQIAFLVRNSRKKSSVNVTIQETTFFDKEIYNIIKEYKFREGGARDFLKCIDITSFLNCLESMLDNLIYNNITKKPDIDDCISRVRQHGKFWYSIGCEYSWYVFKQQYQLDFTKNEWNIYNLIIDYMKRPVEWGGNAKDILYDDLLKIAGSEDIIKRFINKGVIRKIYDFGDARYRLTAPGFLMWERHNKWFLLEFLVTKLSSEIFEVEICKASDVVNFEQSEFKFQGTKKELLSYIIDNIYNYKFLHSGISQIKMI